MRDKDLYERILGIGPPWYVREVDFNADAGEVVVRLDLKGSIVLACPECKEPMPGYDRKKRRWRHLDTCQYRTFLEADIPRGQCAEHGVKQVPVPWAEEFSRFTALFERLVIDWLQDSSQLAVSRHMNLTWHEVHGIMARAVKRGLARRQQQPIAKLGVDEKSFQKHHEFVTVVCNGETGDVLHVGDEHGKESLDTFYLSLSKEQKESVQTVTMDMWDPYVASTKEHIPGAEEKIVFDKFHVAMNLNKAVDSVRKEEMKTLLGTHDSEILKGTKYLWLKNPKNFRADIWRDFQHLRTANLRTAKAWAIKQMANRLWDFTYLGAALRYFSRWYFWATHSRLGPMIRIAKLIKRRLKNILTFLKHRTTNALSEAVNSKIQWIKYTARGFRNRENFKAAIYFYCGGLNLYPS